MRQQDQERDPDKVTLWRHWGRTSQAENNKQQKALRDKDCQTGLLSRKQDHKERKLYQNSRRESGRNRPQGARDLTLNEVGTLADLEHSNNITNQNVF